MLSPVTSIAFINTASLNWFLNQSPLSGHPGEQDDSENSTIYITGLTEKATLPDMADFFKHCGSIRVRVPETQDLATLGLSEYLPDFCSLSPLYQSDG